MKLRNRQRVAKIIRENLNSQDFIGYHGENLEGVLICLSELIFLYDNWDRLVALLGKKESVYSWFVKRNPGYYWKYGFRLKFSELSLWQIKPDSSHHQICTLWWDKPTKKYIVGWITNEDLP